MKSRSAPLTAAVSTTSSSAKKVVIGYAYRSHLPPHCGPQAPPPVFDLSLSLAPIACSEE
jgi:hypothetical protein|eukprot:7379609-Prymnesium_polylepis.1